MLEAALGDLWPCRRAWADGGAWQRPTV